MPSMRRVATAVLPRNALNAVRRFVGHSDEQWLRVVMNREIRQRPARLRVQELSVAEISGRNYAERRWRDYVSLSYPDFDLMADVPLPGPFDLVICEQVRTR